MKNLPSTIFTFGFLFAAMITISSCTQDFAEINTNPNDADSVDPLLQFSNVLNRGASERFDQWRGNLIYCSIWSQQLSGEWEPDRYITTNEDWLSAWWTTSYTRVGKDIIEVINNATPESNLQAAATIFKVLYFQRLTDMYGDMPYSQANQGAVFAQPVYDTQEDIYKSFVRELKIAIDALSTDKDQLGNADIIYQGDINKWKSLGASLLMRVAMRMSDVDEATARDAVLFATNAGLMNNREDIALLSFSGSNTDGPNVSGISEVFQDFGISGHLFRYSDEVVNRIIAFEDPRESTLLETYTNDGNVDNTVGPGNHLGRPNGIAPGTNDFVFAQPRRDVMVAYNSPVIYFSYAESEFLRAEAIQRGFIADGNAQQAYENGIYQACKMLSRYPNAQEISDRDINDYIEGSSVRWRENRAMELIHTQKWLALLFDGFEAYANLRRSGFPEVTPGLFDGESNGEIPKRLRYPNDEKVNNETNYKEAAARLANGDRIDSPLWWDVD
jgi:hypothetical protein